MADDFKMSSLPDGVYVSKSKWPHAWDVRVAFKQTKSRFTLTLIDDALDYRHIDPPLDDAFLHSRKLVINKNGSKHALVDGKTYFVLYPFRAGVPFLFDLEGGDSK